MGMKKNIIHAPGPAPWTKRPLCEKRQGKVSSDPDKITCVACGRAAQRIVDALTAEADQREAESLHGRQRAALAAAQPPRWWEGKANG
jgi:hypothetical protein